MTKIHINLYVKKTTNIWTLKHLLDQPFQSVLAETPEAECQLARGSRDLG